MGIMVYSLVWVLQDTAGLTTSAVCTGPLHCDPILGTVHIMLIRPSWD